MKPYLAGKLLKREEGDLCKQIVSYNYYENKKKLTIK